MRRASEEQVEIGKLKIEKGEEKFPLMQRLNGNSSMSPVTRGLKQRSGFFSFREMKETLNSGKFLFSQTCCTVHTSRRLGYLVLATGV